MIVAVLKRTGLAEAPSGAASASAARAVPGEGRAAAAGNRRRAIDIRS
jgi:hypothetical protein